MAASVELAYLAVTSSNFVLSRLAGGCQRSSFDMRKVVLSPLDRRHNGARPSNTSCSMRKILRPSAFDKTVKDKDIIPSGLSRFLRFAQPLDRVDEKIQTARSNRG